MHHQNHRGARRRMEEKEIEITYLKKVMKENFPNLAKETDFQEGLPENPKEAGPKEEHTKVHHNYITQG